jgi:CubicO group peptidase (beta-lactamase class C family)
MKFPYCVIQELSLSYSNVGYELLGPLIELITNKPYRQYMIDHISRPLGMYDSGYDLTTAIIDILKGVLPQSS